MKISSRPARLAPALLLSLVFSGCAAPKIDNSKFVRPTTVVIDDFPDVNSIATIGFVTPSSPRQYFSDNMDALFIVNQVRPGQPGYDGGPMVARGTRAAYQNGYTGRTPITGNRIQSGLIGGVIAGAIGGVLAASAEETQQRAAEFPALVTRSLRGANMHNDLMQALRTSLAAKGMRVVVSSESRNMVPRLRWPALNEKGAELAHYADWQRPPIDADLVVQISPMALYAAPGPLNNYNAKVGIGVALYNGRTREFLGWQAFQSDENKLWYASYSALAADIEQAGPALHRALLGLVPQVLDAISGGQK